MRLFTNNASTTLASPISNVALSMTVATGDGAKFPSPTGGDYFMATLYRIAAGEELDIEIVKCTARSGDVLTIQRGQEGTTAVAHSSGDWVGLRVTAGAMNEHETAIAAKDASNGYAGLTLMKINFMNVAATIKSFFTNTNTVARTYTFQDRDGTIADLGANTFTGNQNLSDNRISRAMLVDTGHVFVDKGNSSTTTQTLDFTAGGHQKVTATGNHTFAFSNWPPTGNTGFILFEATNYGAYTITPPTVNWIKPDGTTTTSLATYLAAVAAVGGRASLQASGTDFMLFWSRDAGTTVYGKLI